MIIREFFYAATWTLRGLVYDETERVGIVVDSVRDFDAKSGRTSWHAAEKIAFVEEKKLRIPYVIDAHADHLSGLPFFKERFGAKTAIGAAITEVQKRFVRFSTSGRTSR